MARISYNKDRRLKYRDPDAKGDLEQYVNRKEKGDQPQRVNRAGKSDRAQYVNREGKGDQPQRVNRAGKTDLPKKAAPPKPKVKPVRTAEGAATPVKPKPKPSTAAKAPVPKARPSTFKGNWVGATPTAMQARAGRPQAPKRSLFGSNGLFRKKGK